jgi:PKD repeat protein
LAYDGFSYPNSQALDDMNGGAGWSDAWLVQNDDKTLPGYQIGASPNSLTYNGLQTLGAHAVGGQAYLTAGRRLDAGPDGPFADYVNDFDNGIGTQASGELWMSALLQKSFDNNQSVFVGMHSSDLPWCDNCTAVKFEIGYFDGHSDVGGQRRWTLRIADNYYPTTVPVTAGMSTFVAARIRFSAANTEIALFINPGSLGNNTPTPIMTQTSAQPLVFRSVVAYLGDSPNNGAIDEIRVAKTYACVAPDNSITVDLPPVAVISATSNDGQAPLSIDFSANNSYDPEGGPLTYSWNLGDGSPAASGLYPSHIYTALGHLNVRLTVTDMAGLQHTAVYPITVRNAQGQFPCQSSFTVLKPADCNGQGGIIRINDHPAVFSLKNQAGMVLPVQSGNQYQNLPVGIYQYTASGADGCADNYPLHVSVDSSTCPGWTPALCQLSIGTNMSGLADWVPERPLRNLLKHVRPEPIAFNDDCFCWDNGNLEHIALDADGYPTYLPQNANGVPNKLRYMISSEGANVPPGASYVLLYDGEGELSVGGSAVETSNTPGRIQFNATVADNMFFVIHESQVSNPVRNIRLLRLSDEFADLEAQPFYQGFLDKIAPFKVLRFMDWGATNQNHVVNWSDRSLPSHFTYGTPEGVPYEMMVKLANQTKKDVWICVPHAADSNYVAQMATLFRNQLNSDLNIYLEYSNEVWNWIFPQAIYNAENAPSNLNYGRAMAEKAARTFRIWHEVFGSQKSRVKRVLGLQAGFNFLNEQILSQLHPSEWDLGSPTSYIGLDHSENGNPVLHAGSTPADIIQNARSNWAEFRPSVKQDYNNIKLFGKEIVNYEGGQHFVGNVFGIPYPYQQAMWDAQYTQGIYDLYSDMLDTIRTWGSRMFGNFSLSSPQESVYGSWGVLNDIDLQPPYLSTAPKYQALLDQICPETPSSAEDAISLESHWKIIPNPNNGKATLLPDVALDGPCFVQVFDVLGRVVCTTKTRPGDSEIPLNLELAPSGLYMVQVAKSEVVVWQGKVLKE